MQLTRAALPRLTVPHGPADAFPVRVLQFGEGNFLRAYFDWMIDKLNSLGKFNGSIQAVEPRGGGSVAEKLNRQQGLYTVLERGMIDGKPVESPRVITAVRGVLNPLTEWDKLLECAARPELRFVVSNTTEAGIVRTPEPFTPGVAQKSFPAKLTALMFHRFEHRAPAPVFIPCELIENNGATLRECMEFYAADWNLPPEFHRYLTAECVFVNTLVDRIVAGYPRAEAAGISAKLGYDDELIDCAEPFHFLAWEGPAELESALPFAAAGIQAVRVPELRPYRDRKVRFLNGAHTALTPAALLAGFSEVAGAVAAPAFNRYLRKLLFTEIFPTVALDDAEKRAFAEAVLERFANPYAHHQLKSIALNSLAKWPVRCLGSLTDSAAANGGALPRILSFSLAALLEFTTVSPDVSDNPDHVAFLKQARTAPDFARRALRNTAIWGRDLDAIPGLTARVAADLETIATRGIAAAVAEAAQ